jgi:GT2 family glycosyltransferase
LSEAPPRFGSQRFRGILWRALLGEPLRAASGLYWFATRRRVRGWAWMLAAAANGPNSYKQWIRSSEERVLARYREAYPIREGVPLIAWVMGDQSDETAGLRTVESLRFAFGDKLPIYADSLGPAGVDLPAPQLENLAAALSFLLEKHPTAWLLVALGGDVVSPELGDILERALQVHAKSHLLYWDEDTIGASGRADPWVKPDWDESLFRRLGNLAGASIMALDRAATIAQSMPSAPIDQVSVERLSMTVAADGVPSRPAHLCLILTHRAKRNALREECKPARAASSAETWPSVSVLVPTRDRADLLADCLGGLETTAYRGAIELILIDNGSVEPTALRIIERVEACGGAKVIRDAGEFNFSRLNNVAAAAAAGEFLCLLNNDVEPLDPDWLTKMVSHAVDESIGAVGAMLLYPSGRIQHVGVAIGLGGAAGHVQKGVDPSDQRFWTWHRVTREVSAVTAAAMVVRKSTFLNVGGFDEVAFPIAFNDVDLCLRLKAAGLRNLYVAEARLLHRESESRGDDRSPEDARRFASEIKALQERWQTEGFADPHHSSLFSAVVEPCVLVP